MSKNLPLKLMALFYCIFYCVILYAENRTYFGDHARGWHWYEVQDVAPDDSDDDNEDKNDPIVQMNAIQMMVKRTLDQAILNPTLENVQNYIAIQNQVAERSARFSKLWQAALLQAPQLDFSLRHPTNNLARQVEVDQENAEEMQAIKKLAQESGLFFFYRSTCPYCRAFAPILKRFTEHYGIQVMAITTDGINLPEFPHSYTDQGQSATFQIKVEPALFIVNPYSHKAVPVGYGLMSESDLKKRILEIARGVQSS